MLKYRIRPDVAYLSLFGYGYMLTSVWPISATPVARLGRWRLFKC